MTTQATAAEKSHGVEQLLADVPPGETPDLSGAFPRLEETRSSGSWRRGGSAGPRTRGDVLIAEGEPEDTFYVLLSGRVAVVEALGTPGPAGGPACTGPAASSASWACSPAQPAYLTERRRRPG